MLKNLLHLTSLSLLTASLIGCALIPPSITPVSHKERSEVFPPLPIDVANTTEIRWNSYGVPYVLSKEDPAAFFALGAAQAHLRLGQMELIRRITQGRLSEMVGPFAVDIDHTLRIVNLGEAAPSILANMEPENRTLLKEFVRGINWYTQSINELPAEFRALNLKVEPWNEEDVVTISRLAGIDLSWIFYFAFLTIEDENERSELWNNFINGREDSPPSFENNSLTQLTTLFHSVSKTGSNSLVISGKRTQSGIPLVANDPHLGVSLPNFWLLAGLKSESFHCVGMMIPGLPFFALGRNPEVSWGGTNMRAISSHLIRVPKDEELTSRTETIKVRGWFDTDITLRRSSRGPILSDSPLISHIDDTLALEWVGHQTDASEIDAFLNANRAKNSKEFLKAFDTYAVSAQNILYATKDGDIGQLLAYRQPVLQDPSKTLDLIKENENTVAEYRDALTLPSALNPEEGFIASANNKPFQSEVPLALSYSHRGRYDRMAKIISELPTVTINDLKAIQRDVYSASSVEIRDGFLSLVDNADKESLSKRARILFDALNNWDGNYTAHSRGALAYHLVVSSFSGEFFEREGYVGRTAKMVKRGDTWRRLILSELTNDKTKARAKELFLQTLQSQSRTFLRINSWGDIHRLRLQHPLGMIPLLGRQYRFGEVAASGSSDTLLKTAHSLTPKKHRVTYGAQSRHISDLSSPDENYFVLLGGQDGWLKSENLLDQIPLWMNGEYIKMPLSDEGIAQSFKKTVPKRTK